MKSYYAASVQTAMEEARKELGGEAILVTSRLAPAEAGKARQYEVVFAVETPEKTGIAETPRPSRESLEVKVPIDAVLREIKEMRLQLEQMRKTSRGPVEEPRWLADAAEKRIFAQLIAADADPDLAQQLIASASRRMTERPSPSAEPGGRFFEVLKAVSADFGPARVPDLRAAVAAEIRDVFRVGTGLGSKGGASATIAALIGPPGAGKTSTIAKLAVEYGLKQRRPVLLVSTDNQRVAAAEQLRGFASVLGVRFELAPSVRALSLVVDEHRGDGLILIDTPGFSAHELKTANPMAQFLADRTDIEKHLVLPAPARCADTNRVASAYEAFRPSHLIFSRLDETELLGPALSEAMGSGRPVSFFTTGQRVPEDIEEANADALIRRLLPVSEPEQRIAVAA